MTKAWRLAGRWIGILMVLCFFMPFFGISCAGQELVSISGMDMVYGGKPGGLLADGGDMGGGMGGGEMDMKVGNVDPEPLAIAAFACALIVAVLAWVRKKQATMAAAVLAFAGLGAMVGLKVVVGGKLEDKSSQGMKAQQPERTGDSFEDGMKEMATDMGNEMSRKLDIDAGTRMGFWIVCILLVVSGVFAALGLKDPGPSASPPMAAPGGPPQGYQLVYVPPGGQPPPGSMPPPGGGYPPAG